MRDAYLDRLLGEREQIVLVTRQHWLVLAEAIIAEALLLIGIIALVTLVLTTWVVSPLVALGYLLVLLPILALTRDVLAWANRKYVVTTRRVIQISGVVNKNVLDSSLEKVNDVRLEQSAFGRLLGYGDVEILTASELGSNRFSRIADPIRFKTAMLNAKERLERETVVTPAAGGRDVPSLIAALDILRQQGVLTEEEFNRKKAELLAKL